MTEIKRIHYRDVDGTLLWSDRMIFSRLHGVGEEMRKDGIDWRVRRVAVANDVQHVNLELV